MVLCQCDSGSARRNLPYSSLECLAGCPYGALGLSAFACPSLSLLVAVTWSRSSSLFLFGGEGFVSTVTNSSDSGIGEGTLRFRDPSLLPSLSPPLLPLMLDVEARKPRFWDLEGQSQAG